MKVTVEPLKLGSSYLIDKNILLIVTFGIAEVVNIGIADKVFAKSEHFCKILIPVLKVSNVKITNNNRKLLDLYEKQ